MATIDDVARAAGVSISTVSYALSGKRSIKESTRNRVLDAAAHLGYLPNASARTLAANRSQIFAVTAPLHPDTDHSAHMVFAMEVTKAARDLDYDTLLLVHNDALDGMKRSAATSLADGIIVLDVDAHDPRADLARQLACPVVFIGVPEDTTGLVCVDLDFEAAAALAVDRLVAAGRKRIGLISHPEETLSRESNFPLRFLHGFERHVAELGIEHVEITPRTHRGLEAVEDVLDAMPDVDGLVLNTNVDVASSVGAALALHGKSVPTDVSVIAAGVTFSTARFPVPFDTIPLDAHASCSAAVEMLARIVETSASLPETTLIPPTYIDQGSVAPAFGHAPTPAR
ncbi:LacI family DNA-binding transcriptional regulator [Demequina sp. NBRC 110056]|uniref:LacI family DNA-binding transcriptional regulator n=1 Tax=Demequina sp. NBRC 110056 TaxID=1570345 RepID=UPI0009FBCB54|nr:LacI family DNA-binding transcriptional regulator [Demequina sp. NBRC 110056]